MLGKLDHTRAQCKYVSPLSQLTPTPHNIFHEQFPAQMIPPSPFKFPHHNTFHSETHTYVYNIYACIICLHVCMLWMYVCTHVRMPCTHVTPKDSRSQTNHRAAAIAPPPSPPSLAISGRGMATMSAQSSSDGGSQLRSSFPSA